MLDLNLIVKQSLVHLERDFVDWELFDERLDPDKEFGNATPLLTKIAEFKATKLYNVKKKQEAADGGSTVIDSSTFYIGIKSVPCSINIKHVLSQKNHPSVRYSPQANLGDDIVGEYIAKFEIKLL